MKTTTGETNKLTHYPVTKARAIDGDTIIASLKLDFGIEIERRIRLKYFFAPEHHGLTPERAEAARLRLQHHLDNCIVELARTPIKEDQHGRIVAILFLDWKPADPYQVLGDAQLSPEAHATDLRFAKAQRSRKGGVL